MSCASASANENAVGDIADFDGQAAFVTTDGRVRNPVPSKLHGKAENKNGNFAVMHIDLKQSEKAERNAAAKRTSEGTEAAARVANRAGYQSVKRSKLAWPPQDGDASPDTTTRAPPLGLAPHDAKAEQARLLTLLRSVHPIVVVDQLCKALAYFGGIPGAPAPDSNSSFPQSAGTNGSGSQFISWLAEIFPAREGNATSFGTPLIPDAAPISGPTHTSVHPTQNTTTQNPDQTAEPDASAVPVKRGRGRPKGSKGKPKAPKPPESSVEPPNSTQEPNMSGDWAGYSQNTGSQPDRDPNSTPAKKRGRPKGSKNKPKTVQPDQASPAPATTSDPYLPPVPQLQNSIPSQSQQEQSQQQHYSYPNNMNFDVSSMMSGTHGSNNWAGLGIQPPQSPSMANNAGPANNTKKRKPGAPSRNEPDSTLQNQQGGGGSIDEAKRRRISNQDNPSSQMLASASFNSQTRPHQQRHQQQQQPQAQAQAQAQAHPQGQHRPNQPNFSPTIPSQRPGMNMARGSNNMYNTQHMLMHPADLFSQQRHLSNDMNAPNTTNNTTSSSIPRSNSSRNSKSPMFPPAESTDRRDTRMGYNHNKNPSRQHQQQQQQHPHQPSTSSATASPSLNTQQHQQHQFHQNYPDQSGYMGLSYGALSSRNVQNAANAAAAAASFGGTRAGGGAAAPSHLDILGSDEQTSGMRNRMYRSMQQQQQQQQQHRQ